MRAHAEALFEARLLICPKCGNPREVCSDPDVDWYPQRSVCYASITQDVAERRWKAKRAGKSIDAEGINEESGTAVWVSTLDLSPDDDFCDPPQPITFG